MVKYCVANECPINEWACALAAENGHLEVLKYLHEEAKAPWDSGLPHWAAQNGHLHILEYLVERKFDKYDEFACECAAKYGHLDCLKYLHETAKAPWDSRAVRERTGTTTPNVYNTSSTTTVPYHAVGLTKTELYTPRNKHTHTHTKERHTERKKYTIYACKKRDTLTLISVSETSPEKQSSRPYSYHTQHRDAFESEKAKKSKSRERSVSVFQEASI